MAITGKFAADFENFYAAVQKSEVHLREFESNSAKVESRLNAVSDAFSGRKTLQEATIAVKAIEEIGGATALTATEQAKVNKLIGDALVKYEALGKEAPDDMKALYEATKSVEAPTDGLSTKMIAVGTATGQMAAEAVMALGKLAIEGVGMLAEELGYLVMQGGEVSDISGNFERLATSTGHVAATMLGELRAGTHGTIADFDLMKIANEQMAAGLNLSDEQMGTLAKGAFNLAQATGGDVKSGLDAMSQAMITGNAKSIQLLTGKLDLASAETKYALSLGKTGDQLTQGETLYARQQALLDGVAEATARVGEQSDGIGEKVEQAAAKWENFHNELAKTVAESPVLAAGLDAVQTALEQAFGGNQETLIAAIASGINQAAIFAADFGLGAVEMARVAAQAFGALMIPINGLVLGILELVTTTSEGIATMAELAASVPGVGDAFEGTATATRNATTALEGMRAQAEEDFQTVKDLAAGHSALDDTLGKVSVGLATVKAAMVEASLSTKGAREAATEHTIATGAQGAAARQAATDADTETEALKREEATLKAATVEKKKMAAALVELQGVGTDWRATVAALDQGVVAMAEAYLRAGAAAGTVGTALTLTDGDVKAITASIKSQDKALDDSTKKHADWAKSLMDIAKEARGLWDEYDRIRGEQTKTATDQQIAEVERWKRNLILKHEEAGTLSQDMYNAIAAVAAAKLENIRVDWQTLTDASTTNLQQTADRARATYEEAALGHHNLTEAKIEELRRIAEAAQTAADQYGTAFEDAGRRAGTALTDAATKAEAAATRSGASAPARTAGGAVSGAGAPASGFSFNNPYALNWNMSASDREARAQELGGVVNYDDYGNPYVFVVGRNSPGRLQPQFLGEGGVPLPTGTMPLGYRATGGPVTAGGAYIVGEQGPELFIPQTDGRVATRAGTAINVVVQVSGAVLGTTDQLARLVGDALVGRLRQQGVQLPASV